MGEQSTLFYGDAGTIVEIKENVNTATKFSDNVIQHSYQLQMLELQMLKQEKQ